ncbi:cold shock domain-containing protein [Micromonospora marina]|uniref:cold shock domain-containing protein n=1 Tax=Micromonospora marina TaxID=307120 RepID=UPI0034535D7B
MVVVTSVGRVLRFDELRGYGFIEPVAGGDDVFVHANDFGSAKHLVRPGVMVEYEVSQSDRGLKVASVRILTQPSSAGTDRDDPTVEARGDDEMCDVLTASQFMAEVTELLIQRMPSLTGEQIAQCRQHLADHARSHGWLDS